ncbi:hypothetical protein EZS27_007079 [termite gut metagenome]|uniref:Uncharacterized protein n=1 Tax=termite gut metagenome TaxID=433724 RepID=A0A5J4SHU9_9ZZZZ
MQNICIVFIFYSKIFLLVAGGKAAKSHVSPLESRTISLVDGGILRSVTSALPL